MTAIVLSVVLPNDFFKLCCRLYTVEDTGFIMLCNIAGFFILKTLQTIEQPMKILVSTFDTAISIDVANQAQIDV